MDAKILEIFKSVDDGGKHPLWFRIVRAAGVMLGVYLLSVFLPERTDRPSAEYLGMWLEWILSSLALAVFLIFPWRIIRIRFIWFVMYVLFLAVFLMVVYTNLPGFFWAQLHGAFSGVEQLFVFLALICILLQFIVIAKMRP